MRKPTAKKKTAAAKKAAKPKAVRKPARKQAAKKSAPQKAARAKPAKKPAEPLLSLVEFRQDFIDTLARADRNLSVAAREDSESGVNYGWWDHGDDMYDVAPAYKRYRRNPKLLDEIMDGILTRAWSRLPKDGPDSDSHRFS